MKKIDWLPYGMLPVPVTLKAWKDPLFAEELLTNPLQTLKNEGYAIPEGIALIVHENAEHTNHLVLPTKPSFLLGLDEEEMSKILREQTKCGATGTCD